MTFEAGLMCSSIIYSTVPYKLQPLDHDHRLCLVREISGELKGALMLEWTLDLGA